MTWPFTFSSPPSVEFHRRKAVLGILEEGARVKAARGSYCNWMLDESVLRRVTWLPGFPFRRKRNLPREKCEKQALCEELSNTKNKKGEYTRRVNRRVDGGEEGKGDGDGEMKIEKRKEREKKLDDTENRHRTAWNHGTGQST